MKKIAIVAFALGLAGCSEFNQATGLSLSSWAAAGEVAIMGRTWAVSQNAENPASYRAVRDNNNLNPFGRPAARRTPQAVRAIEKATGCRVVRSSLYQNVSAEFFAHVACK